MSYAVKKYNESVLYRQEGPVRIELSKSIRGFYFQEVGTRDYFTTKKYRNVLYNQEVPKRIVLSKSQLSTLVDGN